MKKLMTATAELTLLTENGMSPMDAIKAATSSAADLLGTSASVGSVQAGEIYRQNNAPTLVGSN